MGKASTDLRGCQAVKVGLRSCGVQSLHKKVLGNYINFWGFCFEKGMGVFWWEIVFERADHYYCRNAGLLMLRGGSTTRMVSVLPIPSPLIFYHSLYSLSSL